MSSYTGDLGNSVKQLESGSVKLQSTYIREQLVTFVTRVTI